MDQDWKMHDRVGILISTIARMSRTRFDQHASKMGLTRPQWRAINCIKFNEGINQSRLAEMLEVGHITVTKQIDLLEMQGWVERRPDVRDRRSYRLYLTRAVAGIIEQIREKSDLMHAETFRGMPLTEQRQLEKLLGKLHRNLADCLSASVDDGLSVGELPAAG